MKPIARRGEGGRLGVLALGIVLISGCTTTPPVPGPSGPFVGLPSPSTAGDSSIGTAAPVPTPLPAPPTSRDLIAAAVAAGRIDEPTALEYRVFALFGDSRLPQEFQGAPDRVVDSEVLDDVRTRLADLPAAIAATLTPYVVRPNDTRSVFSTLSVAPVPSTVEATRHFADIAVDGFFGPELPLCLLGWVSVPSAAHNFRVTARCPDGWSAPPQQLQDDIETVVQMVDDIWQRESAFMGIEPLADQADSAIVNDDDRVDVYLLDKTQGLVDGRELILDPSFVAAALQTQTSDATSAHGTSGYLLLDRSRMNLGASTFKSDVIHEFFHILQSARNKNRSEERWFREATAVWADAYFQPETAQAVYDWFDLFRAHPEISLTALSPEDHEYEAFIWPFFMAEQFGPDSISRAWAEIGEREGTASDVLDVIDGIVGGFPAVFRDFAVRNFNTDLDPSDKNAPVKPLHQNWGQGGMFTTNQPPFVNGTAPNLEFLRPTSTPLEFRDSIASLSAHYYVFQILPDVDTQIGQVVFDFTELVPHDALDVDVLVAIRDPSNTNGVRWERRRESRPPDQLKFCRNDPKDDLVGAYLILTNHDKDPQAKIGDSFKVFSPAQPCAAGQITYRQTTTEKSATEASVEDDTLTISLNLVFKDGKVVNDGGSWTFNGRYDYTGGSPDCPSTTHATYSGTGTWVDNGEPQEGIGTIGFAINGNVPLLVGWVVPHFTSVTNDCLSGTKTTEGPFPIPWTFGITGQPIDPNGGPYDMGSSADYTNGSRGQVHVESHGVIVAPTGSG